MPHLHLMIAAGLLVAASLPRELAAAELPSFMQAGDAFCTDEADFDDFAAHGRVRPNSATETCVLIDKPTRVAVMRGASGTKSMIRVIAGPMAYSVGWTNGKLPLAS